MATSQEVTDVRRMANEPGTDTYTDIALSALVDGKGSVLAAVQQVWVEKAGALSELVNTSESGSSRSLGDLYKNALAMSSYYASQVKAAEADPIIEEIDAPFTMQAGRG